MSVFWRLDACPRRRSLWLATGLILCGVVRPVSAEAADVAPTSVDTWIVSLGFTSTAEPSYLGARRFRPTLMPTISARRGNEPEEFSAPEDGLDYTLFGTKAFQIGPVANLRGGRTISADPRLEGLKKYPDTIDAGLFVNVWPVENLVRVRLEVRQGLRDDDGVVADLNTDLVSRIGAFTLSGGPRLSFGDGPANRLELGVSELEATRSGLMMPYRPGAGLRSFGYGVALSYDWSPEWRTTVFHRLDQLVGVAARSPIANRLGEDEQATFGMTLTYSFATKLPFD